MSHIFFHSLHQRVLACDAELPFLDSAAPVGDPDLTLRFTPVAAPGSATPWHQSESTVMEKTANGDLLVRFADDTRFLVRADGREIALVSAPAAYTRDDLAAYALGPVLTAALHLQGAVLLHASAVVLGGKGVLFAGPSGSGKSTTVAMLHRVGYAVLADDVVEITGTRALPAVPALRLWPDVLDTLYGSAAAFPDRAPSWDKKLLRIHASTGGCEIAAILFLEPRAEEPRLTPLDARSGWTRLIADAPAARLPDADIQRRIFEVTSALADRVPLFAFAAPALEQYETLGVWLEESLR